MGQINTVGPLAYICSDVVHATDCSPTGNRKRIHPLMRALNAHNITLFFQMNQ